MRTIPITLLLRTFRGGAREIVRLKSVRFRSDAAALVYDDDPVRRPRWGLAKDSSAQGALCVLAQLPTNSTTGRLPLAIRDDAESRDGEVEVAFRRVAEPVGQAGGDYLAIPRGGGDRPTKALLDSFGDNGNVSIRHKRIIRSVPDTHVRLVVTETPDLRGERQ